MTHRLLPLIPLSIVLLNTFFLHSGVIGLCSFGIYIFLLLRHLTHIIRSYAYAGVILLSGTMIIQSILYYAHGTTTLSSNIVLVASWFMFFLPHNTQDEHLLTQWIERIRQMRHPFHQARLVGMTVLVACLDSILLGILWAQRTTDLMPSPWQAVNLWFFVIFMMSTLLLIYTICKCQHKPTAIALLSLHFFTMYAIVGILYPLGYGFDAFIHRATEQWIFQHGAIFPKEPYYIGQYSTVVFLAILTKLPLFWIDVFFVPVLAALFIPSVVSRSLTRIWPKQENIWHMLVVLAIPFLPFLSFHLTTPHNVVMLFSLLTIFTTLAYLTDGKQWYVPLLLTIASLLTHPLIGAPIFGFFLTAVLMRRTHSRATNIWWLFLGSIGQMVLLPLMFTLNNLRTGNGLPTVDNPFLEIPRFVDLFSRPYWYLEHAPILWELVYAWERLIIPLALVLACAGFIRAKKKTLDVYLFPLTALALFLSAWLLRSWIVFPNVVVYEQTDYPLRLVRASMLFLLPWMLYGVYLFITSFTHRHIRTVVILGCAGALTMSLYFSYPQRNIKARFPGFNVTATDFQSVEMIHGKNIDHSSILKHIPPPPENTLEEPIVLEIGTIEMEESPVYQDNYVVLANQLVSVAALTRYGFDHTFDTPLGELYYYSIPTGGPLYQQYGKMLYEGQKREFMIAAMDLVGVDTGYFVVNGYWANADKIIQGAKQTADSWWNVGDGDVWIFVYTR